MNPDEERELYFPPDFSAGVLRRVASERRRRRMGAVAAGALLVLVGGAVWLNGPAQRPDQFPPPVVASVDVPVRASCPWGSAAPSDDEAENGRGFGEGNDDPLR